MSDAPSAGTLRAGRYAIIGVLGAGSQAETLDAVDKQDGRAVAIKRFQVRGAKSWKDVELAEREARVLATLSHPNLPVYIEHFEEDGALYLVMEKIDGETLASLRRRKVSLSSQDIARFLTDAESVLSYLHSRLPPIIHRDIKPGNVIRRADGSFALVDFGSVRDQLKPEGGSTVVGTFGYMAPEQFQGRALPGSDVYAVGATALSLVTGCEPENLPHRGLAIDVPAALGRAAEPWLVRALSAMLEPDPDKRPTRVPAPGAGRRAAARPAPSSAPDWRVVRDQGREERRRARDEGRRFRRELKEQFRDESRRVRREARSYRAVRGDPWRRRQHGIRAVAPLLLSVAVLALTAARISTWALFRVFLPLLLLFSTLGLSRRARRVAFRCRELASQIDGGLTHAIDSVRANMLGSELETEEPSGEPHTAPSTRTRVSNAPLRVETDPDLAEFEEDSAEKTERSRREPR